MLILATDGAADIPPGWEEEFNIHIIPINIQFGEKTYLQDVDLDREGFYKLVDDSGKVPKTSQPSPHQFKEFYRSIAWRGETILSIHVTSKLSGTYASAVAAAAELKDEMRVIPVDSACGSVGIAFMCREVRRMEKSGNSVEQIVDYLEKVRQHIFIILTLETLDYARMSGRVGALSAALASMLNVKPIAILRDGILNMTEKVRTRKAAIARVIALAKAEFGGKPVHLAAVQARDPQTGHSLLEQAKQELNVVDSVLAELSISLAANFGPGTVGLVLYPAG
jgi:DegV family protein with EDD domain